METFRELRNAAAFTVICILVVCFILILTTNPETPMHVLMGMLLKFAGFIAGIGLLASIIYEVKRKR